MKPSSFAVASMLVSFFAMRATGSALSCAGMTEAVAYVLSWCVGSIVALSLLGHPAEPVTSSEAQLTADESIADGTTPHRSSHARQIFKCAAIFAVSLALLLSVNFAVGLLTSGGTPRQLSRSTVLTSVLLKPFCEESLFRGTYVALLRRGEIPTIPRILMCALLFACIHRGIGVAVAAAAGVILGIAEESSHLKSKGFALTFAVHGTYNLILCVISSAI